MTQEEKQLITRKTTAESIYAMYEKDLPKLQYQLKKIVLKVKAPGYYYHRWHNPSGQQYSLVINCMQNGRVRYMATPVTGMKPHESFYVVDDYKYQINGRGMTHFTDHFLRRYLEREMKQNIYTEGKVLMHLFEHNVSSVIIWKNKDRTSYICAMNTGLALCSRDPDTNVIHFCTFVSLHQLHDDQREAYDKTKEILSLDNRLYDGSISEDSIEFELLNMQIEKKAGELTAISQSIIQQFKDEMKTE